MRAAVRGSRRRLHRGRDRALGGCTLAAADPTAIAAALERLLDDERHWQRCSQAGLGFVESASWDMAAKQVEAGLREALRERERAAAVRTT